MSDMEEDNVTLPIYSLHIIGAGYFILIAMVIYLLFKKSCKKRRVYTTFENENEQHINPTYNLNNNELLFVSHLNTMNDEFRGSENSVKYTIKSEGKNEIINMKNSDDTISKESTDKSKRVMINTSNQDTAVFIPPDIMKKICVAILEKRKQISNNDETVCEDKNEELNSESAPDEKSTCVSDSELYDIIPNNRLVRVRISASVDYLDPRLSKSVRKSRSSCSNKRDSTKHYPITSCTPYVNANPVNIK